MLPAEGSSASASNDETPSGKTAPSRKEVAKVVLPLALTSVVEHPGEEEYSDWKERVVLDLPEAFGGEQPSQWRPLTQTLMACDWQHLLPMVWDCSLAPAAAVGQELGCCQLLLAGSCRPPHLQSLSRQCRS
jgi:hypothetical protein